MDTLFFVLDKSMKQERNELQKQVHFSLLEMETVIQEEISPRFVLFF